MTTPDPPDDTAREEGRRELALIRQQVVAARAELARLEQKIVEARVRQPDTGNSTLLAVNQQLVLTMLRAQIDAEDALAREEVARTHRRRAQAGDERRQEHLSEANEQLVLAALGAQDQQEAAELAHQRQTRLLALVAHELRHPLAPIRSAAAVLGRISEPSPVLGRMQAIIEQQVQHMARLVNDLVDATRVATGKLRIDRERIDLVRVIEDTLVSCKPEMDQRQQNFIGPDLPARLEMEGDALRLTQVLGNLLDNASKYTPNGGEIRLSLLVSDQAAVLSVSDNGIGITAEALPRVFEPFVQDLHATVFNSVGLGLGLTVVRELVEAHGGTVSASSEGQGRGSRFVVTLPLRLS